MDPSLKADEQQRLLGLMCSKCAASFKGPLENFVQRFEADFIRRSHLISQSFETDLVRERAKVKRLLVAECERAARDGRRPTTEFCEESLNKDFGEPIHAVAGVFTPGQVSERGWIHGLRRQIAEQAEHHRRQCAEKSEGLSHLRDLLRAREAELREVEVLWRNTEKLRDTVELKEVNCDGAGGSGRPPGIEALSQPAPEPSPGFRRLLVLEVSNEETLSDSESSRWSTAQENHQEVIEMFPDIRIDGGRLGLEHAADWGRSLLGQGSVEESVRWLSKCIWLLESGQLQCALADPGWSRSLCAGLYVSRAMARLDLEQWAYVERDCSAALALLPYAMPALHQRALARLELGMDEAALDDITEALRLQPGSAELLALDRRARSGSTRPPQLQWHHISVGAAGRVAWGEDAEAERRADETRTAGDEDISSI